MVEHVEKLKAEGKTDGEIKAILQTARSPKTRPLGAERTKTNLGRRERLETAAKNRMIDYAKATRRNPEWQRKLEYATLTTTRSLICGSTRRNPRARKSYRCDSGAVPPRAGGLSELQRRMGNRATGALLRAKMRVSLPGDACEREADQVAERVLRAPEPIVHRSCAGCAGGAPCQSCGEGEPLIQRMPSDPGGALTVPHGIVEGSGPGQPLEPYARAYFEPRFGRDFGDVRVHTGAAAALSAQGVNARAFTVGRNIVFGAGEYAPTTTEGRRLLAHELTHVVRGTGTSHPIIQRYEGFEHQAFGDEYLDGLVAFLSTDDGERWARSLGFDRATLLSQIRTDPLFRGGRIRLRREVLAETGIVGPVELTPGEIISLMGDFYETWEDLAAAPERELRAILDIMAQEHTAGLSASAAAARYEEITGGRYLALAERNDVHFARRNRTEWRRLHELAIDEAQAAGREKSDTRFHRAMLIDAAAGHFLTDAFASGHLLDKSQVMAAITIHLAAHPARAANPQMQVYLAAVDIAGKMPQLVLKNLHDRLNREGVWAANAAGLRWRTHGDDYLELAQETQRIATLAVFQSRQQVHAARDGQSPDPAEIEALMPDDDTVRRTTELAISYIPAAVREAEGLMYRNRALAPTQFGAVLGAIVESNLDTIANPAREQQVLNLIESANRAGAPGAVAPQFTIIRWK